MLVLGIILTILGVIIFQWSSNVGKPLYERPPILYKTTHALIFILLGIGLLGGGLYSFWQVSYKIVFFLVGGFAVLWAALYFMGSYKNKAERFFQIYKQLKFYHPQTKEEDLLRETAGLYFQNLRWDMEKINTILKIIFGEGEKDSKIEDVKDLFRSVLIVEYPINSEKCMEDLNKRDTAIEWAYKKVFGEQINGVTERPVLTEDTLRRMMRPKVSFSEVSMMTTPVIVYSTPTCPYCKMAKSYLEEKGIAVEEINVAADSAKADEMVKKSGQMGVPVLDIGGTIIVGFDKAKINAALGLNG